MANNLVPNQNTSPECPPNPPDLPAVDPLLHGDIEEFHAEVIGDKKSNQLATALTQMKDCEYKSIDEVKLATEAAFKKGQVWKKDDLINNIKKFASDNFFSVSLYKGRGLSCSRQTNSHSDAVRSGKHVLTKRSFAQVTGCQYKIEYSRDAGEHVTIKKVIAEHNHECNIHTAARSVKLSGKSMENAIESTFHVLAPLLFSGKPIPYGVIRYTIELHVAQGVILNADTIYSIVRGVKDRMVKEDYKVSGIISNDDIKTFRSKNTVADNCRDILKDLIQNTNGDTTSLIHRLMGRFKEADTASFDCRMYYDENGLITCLTWQTGAMRAASILYGDIVFLNARKSENMNIDRVRYQSMVVIGSNKNVLPVSESLLYEESNESYINRATNTLDMTPDWDPASVKLGLGDGFLLPKVRKKVFPSILYQIGPYHLFGANNKTAIWPMEFGPTAWNLIKNDMVGAAKARTEETYLV